MGREAAGSERNQCGRENAVSEREVIASSSASTDGRRFAIYEPLDVWYAQVSSELVRSSGATAELDSVPRAGEGTAPAHSRSLPSWGTARLGSGQTLR